MKLLFVLISVAMAVTQPKHGFTPGKLCTTKDPNFSGTFRYKEHIPYCTRRVPLHEKQTIAFNYGRIPRKDWPKYEFDHLIPLSVGGSDDLENIWPQPIAEAKEKDKVELFVFQQMRDGKMTQAEAVARIRAWFQK